VLDGDAAENSVKLVLAKEEHSVVQSVLLRSWERGAVGDGLQDQELLARNIENQ
jgi:hypothetical protein